MSCSYSGNSCCRVSFNSRACPACVSQSGSQSGCCWLSLDRASNAKTAAQFTYNAHQSNSSSNSRGSNNNDNSSSHVEYCHCHDTPAARTFVAFSFIFTFHFIPSRLVASRLDAMRCGAVRFLPPLGRTIEPTCCPTSAAMTQRLTACRRCLETWLTWVIKQPKCAHKTQPEMTPTTAAAAAATTIQETPTTTATTTTKQQSTIDLNIIARDHCETQLEFERRRHAHNGLSWQSQQVEIIKWNFQGIPFLVVKLRAALTWFKVSLFKGGAAYKIW